MFVSESAVFEGWQMGKVPETDSLSCIYVPIREKGQRRDLNLLFISLSHCLEHVLSAILLWDIFSFISVYS
jgi:hypothetical protein